MTPTSKAHTSTDTIAEVIDNVTGQMRTPTFAVFALLYTRTRAGNDHIPAVSCV